MHLFGNRDHPPSITSTSSDFNTTLNGDLELIFLPLQNKGQDLRVQKSEERFWKGFRVALLKRSIYRKEMILVAIVAELLQEYTVLLARVLEQLFHEAPFPRRMRFLILRNLPFASSTPRMIRGTA